MEGMSGSLHKPGHISTQFIICLLHYVIKQNMCVCVCVCVCVCMRLSGH